MTYDKSKDKGWAIQAKTLIEAYLKNQTESYGLGPQRILQVAREAVNRQGFVLYSDYDADLLIEILNGVHPSTIAWRLFTIKNTLEAHLWRYQGKSKFLPPE